MALKSPVKYRKDGRYLLEEKIELPAQDEQEAKTRGLEDAKAPFDVLRYKATFYERDMQHKWGKELDERIGHNIIRVRQWGNLIRSELQDLILAKEEFQERLRLRKHKLSDSQMGIFAYIVSLIIITTLELPVNIKVFDLFGEEIIFKYLLALIISVLLSVLAHFVGGWIKAEGFKLRSILHIILVIVLLGIIAWIRIRFFAGPDDSSLKKYFSAGLEMNVVAGMFFIINSLLFAMAMVASYHYHDSDPLFVKAKKRFGYHYKRVSNLMCACEGEMLNLQMCISRCQECFKKNRLIYLNAYKSSGAPEPICFKDPIALETDHITKLDERLKIIEEEYNQLRSKVQACLEPVGGCENNKGL